MRVETASLARGNVRTAGWRISPVESTCRPDESSVRARAYRSIVNVQPHPLSRSMPTCTS